MKFHIRSFDYCLELPEKYINVIKKYAKDRKVELVKDDNDDEIAIIEVDSLEILPKLEKDIKEARGTVQSWDFEDIHGLIFNTLDEKEKVYQVDIYDSYIE